ncbi:MAG: AI-2E family transporter [Sphingopyxis sp.]|nr:AI-2E family transporter [Sphingopyxis sp.]
MTAKRTVPLAPGPTEVRDPETRAEFRRAAIWVGTLLLVALVWLTIQPLLLIFAAIVVAAIIDGGVRLLGRVLPVARGWRLTIVILAIAGMLGWVLIFAGTQIAAQAAQLEAVLMGQIDALRTILSGYGIDAAALDPGQITAELAGTVGRVTQAVGSVIGVITSLVLILFLAIFFAMEPRLYERGLAWMVPVRNRAHVLDMAHAIGHTLRRLMAGRLLGMLVEGLATWALLAAYGIPLAGLIGIITGLLVFIPNIGALISGVLMVLVGFSVGTDAGLYAIGVYLFVQTIDGYVIVPMIARRTVDLAPALVLSAQLLFGTLFGILGLALADPIVAMLKTALEKNAARRTGEATG